MGRINFHVTFTSSGVDPEPSYPEITSVIVSTEGGLIEGNDNVKANSQVATINVTGGTAPFRYDITGGTDVDKFKLSDNSVLCNEDLKAGTYIINVQVTDSNSKTMSTTGSIQVAQASYPEIDSVTIDLVNETLKESDAVIDSNIGTISVSGGTEPYEYSMEGTDADKFKIEGTTIKAKEDLKENTYNASVKVTDSKSKEKISDQFTLTVEEDEPEVIVAVPGNQKDLLGKKADELQSDVSIDNESGNITGNLHYINDYTKFSKSESEGHYLALYFEQATQEGNTIEIQVQDKEKKVKLDNDGLYVCRMTEAGRKPLTVTLTTSKQKTATKTLTVSDLQLLHKVSEVINPIDGSQGTGNKTVADLQTGISIDDVGKTTGTLNYVDDYQLNERTLEGNHYLAIHIDSSKLPSTKNVKVGTDNIVNIDKKDWDVNVNVTEEKKESKFKVEVDEKTLYTLDLSKLTLAPKG